jgi:hypothetical protein
MELTHTHEKVRVTSAPSWPVQAGAFAIVVAMVIVGGLITTEEHLACDERGDCTFQRKWLLGSSMTHLGSANRIVAAEVGPPAVFDEADPSWKLYLTAPDEILVIDAALGSSVDAWFEGRIYKDGSPQPAKALPFRASWRASRATIGLLMLFGVGIVVAVLRFVVRYEVVRRDGALLLRVTRLFVWTSQTTILPSFRLEARTFEPLISRQWPWPWGVWCETASGVGYWIAAGLTDDEADEVVAALSLLPPSSAYPDRPT